MQLLFACDETPERKERKGGGQFFANLLIKSTSTAAGLILAYFERLFGISFFQNECGNLVVICEVICKFKYDSIFTYQTGLKSYFSLFYDIQDIFSLVMCNFSENLIWSFSKYVV